LPGQKRHAEFFGELDDLVTAAGLAGQRAQRRREDPRFGAADQLARLRMPLAGLVIVAALAAW
jgi:hypothetical protein